MIHSTGGLTIPHLWPRAPRTANLSGMSQGAFDTLKLAKCLEEAGFAPTQAAATSSAFADTLTELLSTVATKHDLALMELRMTVKLGGMLAAAVGLTAALTKLL